MSNCSQLTHGWIFLIGGQYVFQVLFSLQMDEYTPTSTDFESAQGYSHPLGRIIYAPRRNKTSWHSTPIFALNNGPLLTLISDPRHRTIQWLFPPFSSVPSIVRNQGGVCIWIWNPADPVSILPYSIWKFNRVSCWDMLIGGGGFNNVCFYFVFK